MQLKTTKQLTDELQQLRQKLPPLAEQFRQKTVKHKNPSECPAAFTEDQNVELFTTLRDLENLYVVFKANLASKYHDQDPKRPPKDTTDYKFLENVVFTDATVSLMQQRIGNIQRESYCSPSFDTAKTPTTETLPSIVRRFLERSTITLCVLKREQKSQAFGDCFTQPKPEGTKKPTPDQRASKAQTRSNKVEPKKKIQNKKQNKKVVKDNKKTVRGLNKRK